MAQVVVELSGDEAKLLKSYQKIRDAQDKMDQGLQTVSKSAKGMGEAHGQATTAVHTTFGQKSMQQLQSYIGGIATLTGVVGVFRGAMNQARAETESTMAAVDSLVESRRRLLQVSEGKSGANNQEMNTFADTLAMKGITRQEARNIVFGAKSEGFQGSEMMVTRLVAANKITAESAQRAAGQVRGIYDKQITPEEAIEGVASAAFLSRLDVEQFQQQFPKLAGGAQVAGSNYAEALAIAGYVPTKNERAAEYVATFANQFAITPGFKGIGIMGQVEKLQGMSEGARQKALGTSKEANLAYMWLSQGKGTIQERQRAIAADIADSQSFVTTSEAQAFDPATFEGRLNRQRVDRNIALVRQEISREQRIGTRGFSAEQARIEQQTKMEEAGTNLVTRYAAQGGMKYATDSGATPGVVARTGQVIEALGRTGILQSLQEIITAWGSANQSLERSADKLGDAATTIDSPGNAPRQRAAAAAVAE